MKIIVEIEPTRNILKLESLVKTIAEIPCIDMVAVPDAPLGKPKVLGVMLASFFEHAGIPTIAHVRLRDMNMVLFEQVVWGAYIAGVTRLLFLRGDPPAKGRDVNEVTSEYAVEYVKKHDKLSSRIKAGIYLSMRWGVEKALERVMKTRADFYTVNRLDPQLGEHIEFVKKAKTTGAQIFAYLITARSSQLERLRAILEGQPVRPLEKLNDHIKAFQDSGVDGVILSSPLDIRALLQILKETCNNA